MRDDDLAPAGEGQAGRPLDVVPLPQVAAVGAEDLDPVVLPVGDEQPAVRKQADAMRYPELAGPGADLSPAVQQRP